MLNIDGDTSQVVPADKLHPDIWIGANRKWRRVPSARLERSQFGKVRPRVQSTTFLPSTANALTRH